MRVGTVFPSFLFDVFSGAARAVTFSPPSWISLVSIYVVGVCPYYNVLEYQPLRSSIAKVTVLRRWAVASCLQQRRYCCLLGAPHGLRRRGVDYNKVTQQPTAATHTVRGLSTPLPSPPSAPTSHWQPDLNGNVRGSQGEADGQSSLLSTLDWPQPSPCSYIGPGCKLWHSPTRHF